METKSFVQIMCPRRCSGQTWKLRFVMLDFRVGQETKNIASLPSEGPVLIFIPIRPLSEIYMSAYFSGIIDPKNPHRFGTSQKDVFLAPLETLWLHFSECAWKLDYELNYERVFNQLSQLVGIEASVMMEKKKNIEGAFELINHDRFTVVLFSTHYGRDTKSVCGFFNAIGVCQPKDFSVASELECNSLSNEWIRVLYSQFVQTYSKDAKQLFD